LVTPEKRMADVDEARCAGNVITVIMKALLR